MATLKDLANRMRAKADSLDETMQERKRVIARAVLKELVMSTPVDTSRAVSNWRVSTDNTISQYIEAHFMGELGSTRSASASKAIADAESAIMAGRPLDALAIFNSVPYIRPLNDGSSSQAPAGFVERAILVGRLAARSKRPGLN